MSQFYVFNGLENELFQSSREDLAWILNGSMEQRLAHKKHLTNKKRSHQVGTEWNLVIPRFDGCFQRYMGTSTCQQVKKLWYRILLKGWKASCFFKTQNSPISLLEWRSSNIYVWLSKICFSAFAKHKFQVVDEWRWELDTKTKVRVQQTECQADILKSRFYG